LAQRWSRYSVTFSLDGKRRVDPAVIAALEVFRDAVAAVGLPALPIVRCDLMTYREADREFGAAA
jgi:hypothetical protein